MCHACFSSLNVGIGVILDNPALTDAGVVNYLTIHH